MKKEIRHIKKSFKKNGLYREYTNIFQHKQLKFLSSKIILIFNQKVELEKLISLETELLKKEKNEKMFNDVCSRFAELSNKKADWTSFSEFLYLVYQTSTYWKDTKKGIPNIYNMNNYNELNLKKRQLFNKWFKSMDIDINFNEKLIEVLRSCY